MTVQEVLKHYHKKVPFPLTPHKISVAGYNPEAYLKNLLTSLSKTTDFETECPTGLKEIASFLSTPLVN